MSEFFWDEGLPARGTKVLLATTSYAGLDPGYVFSLQRSRQFLNEAGIHTAYALLSGSCHVDDARNDVVASFLASDCTHLVFIDSDVSWKPETLLRLCKHPQDVVGGVYPYRREDDGRMPVRLAEGDPRPTDDGLLEVAGLPSGFLKISRSVFDELWPVVPHYPSPSGEVGIYFERTLDAGTRWGGDLAFCRRWREMGGTVYADYEALLGHAGHNTHHGSLGTFLRARGRTTLSHVCSRIRAGEDSLDDLSEAVRYVHNRWGALEDVLGLAVNLARRADGPILEAGSGLSTLLMAAAAPGQTVFCLEHSEEHAQWLTARAGETGITNIAICFAPIIGGWYDVREMGGLPERFSMALLDGPPRDCGPTRERFLAHFGERIDGAVVVDDADDPTYRTSIESWATTSGRESTFVAPRALLLRAA